MGECKHCKQDFQIPEEDRKFYEKIKVPNPKLCYKCRRKRRLAHWPFGVLQKRKCDFSGEEIISTYPPNARFPVYKREHWFSDDWDPPHQEIDFSRPFLDQLYELQCKTPHFHQLGRNSVNCDYADDIWECKSAYASRSMAECEDMFYVYRILYSKDCMDITYCYHMEQSYECTYCFRCFNLKFSLNCQGCYDSYFLYDCRECNNCFMCWNLRNQKYHILNKPYSKEEYEEKIKEFKLNSRSSLQKHWQEFLQNTKKEALHKADFNIKTENCTGNYISNCKNCNEAFFMEDAEDCNYVFRSPQMKDCYDTNGLYKGNLSYEVCQSTDLYNTKFAHYSVDCYDSEYIDQCFNSNHLFGCVGLKKRKYCILNKQYTQEEYEELVPRLIKHMKAHNEYGEFFPYRFAYNGFNLSLGAFYYDETEESIKEKDGFLEPEPEADLEGLLGDQLPGLAEEVTDEFVGKPINCAETKRPYTFIKQELDFYRKHNLPLPAFYPENRNKHRYSMLAQLDPRQVKCHKCEKEITTYYPEYLSYEKILCEECYMKEIY
jgi:hypothetical protein